MNSFNLEGSSSEKYTEIYFIYKLEWRLVTSKDRHVIKTSILIIINISFYLD